MPERPRVEFIPIDEVAVGFQTGREVNHVEMTALFARHHHGVLITSFLSTTEIAEREVLHCRSLRVLRALRGS